MEQTTQAGTGRGAEAQGRRAYAWGCLQVSFLPRKTAGRVLSSYGAKGAEYKSCGQM